MEGGRGHRCIVRYDFACSFQVMVECTCMKLILEVAGGRVVNPTMT